MHFSYLKKKRGQGAKKGGKKKKDANPPKWQKHAVSVCFAPGIDGFTWKYWKQNMNLEVFKHHLLI